MGVVYEAHDPILGRTIALKTIHLALAVEAADRDRFEQRFFAEARAAARLSHPGIVVVHDVGRDPVTGDFFIALEHLRGRTLADALYGQGPLDWREALRITARLADALHHAHERGVVHRDVKPENVMLLESGEPKIMDFGIAKLETGQLTAAGQVLGTPRYMAPEQARGEAVDGRSDLFALGAVAYLLLAGGHAFDADSLPAILQQVLHRDPDPPSLRAAGLPPGVDAVVAKALEKAKDARYQTGRALAEDIEDLLAGRAPRHAAGETGPGPLDELLDLEALHDEPEAAPPARPGRARTLAAGATVLAALAIVLGLYLARARRDPAPASTAAISGTVDRAAAPAPSAAPEAADDDDAADAAAGPAQLSFTLEHSLDKGALKVWVDDALVLERTIAGRESKRFMFLTRRQGTVSETLPVAPGAREVRVEVAWDDESKTRTITGTFRPGRTRRLEASVGGLRKSLSLEWK